MGFGFWRVDVDVGSPENLDLRREIFCHQWSVVQVIGREKETSGYGWGFEDVLGPYPSMVRAVVKVRRGVAAREAPWRQRRGQL